MYPHSAFTRAVDLAFPAPHQQAEVRPQGRADHASRPSARFVLAAVSVPLAAVLLVAPDEAGATVVEPDTYQCCVQRIPGRADGYFVPGQPAEPARFQVPAEAR